MNVNLRDISIKLLSLLRNLAGFVQNVAGGRGEAAMMAMRCVMRCAWTPKLQLRGPAVHSLYCGKVLEERGTLNS